MFSLNMREKYESKATIHGISENAMETFLDFVYTGNADITCENVFDVTEAANYMEIPHLRDFCLDFICREMNVLNCASIWAYARLYDYDNLTEVADNILRENFEDVLTSQDFLQLGYDDVCSFLDLEQRNFVTSERDVYNCVINWIKHDLTHRRKHVSKLFHLVLLENLEESFLMDTVRNESLVSDYEECIAKIDRVGVQHGFFVVSPKRMLKYKIDDKEIHEEFRFIYDHDRGSTVKSNEKIYVVSGFGTKSVESIPCIESFFCRDVSVSFLNRMRALAASTRCGNYIYTTGGVPFIATAERQHRHSKTWEYISKMRFGRNEHALVSTGELIYALGGRHDNTAECYDPREGEWRMIPPMNCERLRLSAVTLNGEIYAIGGMNAREEFHLSVEKYKPGETAWHEVASLNQGRSHHGACVVNGKIYVAGGGSDIVEVYDPEANVWEVKGCFECFEDAFSLVSF